MGKTEFITDREIYEKVILGEVPKAEKFVWIATADIKDLHVERRKKMVPFLATLSELVRRGVAVRLLHAKEPGPKFRRDFDRYPNLVEGMEMILCPRVHFKCVVVDGDCAYSGSANLTGAGMGAKSAPRRNFESGVFTTDAGVVEGIMDQFDSVWMGSRCRGCGRRRYCAAYDEIGPRERPAKRKKKGARKK
jgi:phosphatidylserine/phosphatidylglycerophosphate/cardiolipin synthase-like enzyme